MTVIVTERDLRRHIDGPRLLNRIRAHILSLVDNLPTDLPCSAACGVPVRLSDDFVLSNTIDDPPGVISFNFYHRDCAIREYGEDWVLG